MHMLSLSKVTKSYGSHLAVQEVSFSVEQGEVVGFLGPNGAGKTTTMRMIAGLLPPTEGEIMIDDVSVVDNPLHTRAKVGYLPELNPLYDAMDVTSYLLYMARLKRIHRGKRAQSVQDVVRACDLESMRRRPIRLLSRGYKQRVGLAQALLGDPDVLVLDEPTVGLDPNQIVDIRRLIQELGQSQERAVLLSSHILSEVAEVCDRVVILHHGKIVASDTPDRLAKQISGSDRVVVRVKGACDRVVDVLRAVPSVATVSAPIACAADGDNVHEYIVEATEKKDIRSTVARALLDAGFEVLELRIEQLDLEDVFTALTASE